jgi:hypothetical protein
LTWRGWIALVGLIAVAATLAVRNLYGFLSVSKAVESHTLIIESWVPDVDLPQIKAAYLAGHYTRVFLTGGPLEKTDPMNKYLNYPALMRVVLLDQGFDPAVVVAVPAPRERRDRTFTSALALKHWCEAHGETLTSFNIVTTGEHARRTRLLFRRAFNDRVEVGIIPIDSPDFDPHHWWRSSQGVKEILTETIGYLYARVQVAWLTAS